MHRCLMVEWREDWRADRNDSAQDVYARMAWIDINALAAQWQTFAQGDEGRDDDRDEPNGGEG